MLKRKEIIKVVNRVLQINPKRFPSGLRKLIEEYQDDHDRTLVALMALQRSEVYRPLFLDHVVKLINDPLWKRVSELCGKSVLQKNVCAKITAKLADIYKVTTVNIRPLDVDKPKPIKLPRSKKAIRKFKAKAEGAIGRLPRRERDVIKHRFMAERPLTLQETGELMGMTREEVRKVESRAVQRLGKLNIV